MTLEEEYVFKKLAGDLEHFFYAPVGVWNLPELEGAVDGAWVRMTDGFKNLHGMLDPSDIREETFSEWRQRLGC